MSQPLVLSLYPGIGLLDMAFEEEGFCVVRFGAAQNRERCFSFGVAWNGGPDHGCDLDVSESVALFESPVYERAVTASGGSTVPVALGGSGKPKRSLADAKYGYRTGEYYAKACELQGLPPDFLEEAPFTVAGKIHAVGNGVPLPMGRAVARAVKRAMYP